MKDLFEKFLEPSKKVVADKAKSPEETVKEVEKRLLSAGLKIYKGVKRVDKGRLGIPVYLSLYDIEGQKITGKYKQMGKGATESLAKASAIMEVVERFSLFWYYKNIEKNAVFSTFEKLEDRGIPFERIISSVEDEEENKVKEVAKRLIKRVPFYFVPALELGSKKIRYLPFHWFWLIYEYNGSSAGNTYAEAGVQGICEIVERHVSALSVRKGSLMPAIKRDSIKGEAEELLRCYERLGINLWIRDMTFGMPVPTIAVMAMDPSTYPERSEIVYTAGTATSPERALIRALTEVAQLAGDFDTEGRYEESGLPKFSTLNEAKSVLEYSKEVSLYELPDISSEDHVKELETISKRLKELGYEVYLIDVCHPQIEVPAIYSIVPGMLFRERTKIPLLYQFIRTTALYMSPEENKKLLEEVLKEVENRYYVWAYLGNVNKRLNKLMEAVFCYERALSLSPPESDKIAIYTHLADTYFKMQEYKKVMDVVLKGLEIGEIPELYNLLGRACYRLGDYFQAMEAFLRATELNPASAIDYANVGYCLKAINQLSTAQIFFRKALELDPDLTMAKRGLEYCENLLNIKN